MAYNETHTVILTDAELNIEFAFIVDNPNISAIKVLEVDPSPNANLEIEAINSSKKTHVMQNYPNPFNTGTTIPYYLSEASHVNLTIYNQLGQQVNTLVNEFKNFGSHEIFWNAKNSNGNQIESGLYFYRLKTNNNAISGGKLVVSAY